MADDDDPGESYTPPEEEEVKIPKDEQEKLKLELMKLNEQANISLAPKGVDPAVVEKLQDITKGTEESKRIPVKPTSPAEKPVEAQAPPEPPDAPIVMSPDTPKFQQPDYTVKPDVKIRELSTTSKPGRVFSPEVERSLDIVSQMYPNVPRNVLAGFVQVESSGDPKANIDRATQYKGLLQIGREEWKKHGGGGDIYDALQNLKGGSELMEANRQMFIKIKGREPTPAELYLMHQQGPGFYSRGTTTNLAGNLPPDARTPENMTREGFERWWTARINRAIKERGTAPTMRKVEDSGLPAGYLYPGPFADVGGAPLTKGGLPDSPEGQALIAQLMTGTPIAKAGGIARAAAEDASRPTNAQPRYIPKVGTSKETQQVQGELPIDPSSVSHTTMPIPGIMTPGERALMDATNPSVMSTALNYQAMQPGAMQPPPPVADQINKPFGELKPKAPSFVENLMTVMKTLSPINWTMEGVKQAGDVALEATLNAQKAQGEGVMQVAQGLGSGVQDLPVATVGGMVVPAAAAGGLLTGSDTMKQYAAQTGVDMEQWKRDAQKRMGINPDAPTAAQYVGHQLGSNLGLGLVSTVKNAIIGGAAEKYLGPATDYMSKNFPIPNLNPISPANAATVFGKVPMVVNTPAGPLVMNDADIQQFAWGGIFAVGFGAAVPVAALTVRTIRTAKPLGLNDVFDPRREIPGAKGTEAASIPADILKGGIIDQGKMMIDIAERQAKYEKGTRTGIDPIAANEVLQAWRVQTNSGAQNLIRTALENGEMNVPDYRFNVNTSISKLIDFAKVSPQFPEYLRLRAIQDEIRFNMSSNRALPPTSTATPRPVHFDDPNNNGVRFTDASTSAAISRLESDHPDFAQAYTAYRDNLDATRDVISGHPTYNVENYQRLTDHAIQRPTLPLFSADASPKKLFDQFIIGKNPLEIAEANMRKAFEKQLKFDAEQRYIKMTQDNVGNKAFTPRDQAYLDSPQGSKAKDIGAVLTRKHDGETIHYTADPLLVSVMNSGQVPLSAMEQTFALTKNVFQKTTTGAFAPWFAPTGMIRSMEQGWTTAPGGVKTAGGRTVLPAGPLSTLMGLATRTGAQISRPTAQFFRETVANTTLGNILTAGQADLIGRSFEKWYMDSFYRRMEVAGAFSGDSVMEGKEIYKSISQARQTYGGNPHMNPVLAYMENAIGNVKKFTWDPVKNNVYAPLTGFLTNVQEAPAYGWARKVSKGSDDTNRPTIQGRPMSDAELAAHFRNYTGDPSTRGYIYQKDGKTPLNFMSEGASTAAGGTFQKWANMTGRASWDAQAKTYETFAKGAHWARSVTPWAGVLFQSPSATLAAMRDNPVRANLAFMTSHVLPEMTAYAWNSYYSDQEWPVLDEKGQPVLGADGKPKTIKYDYVNHHINGRNSHNLLNNTYFAVPGKPPHEGIEFRHYQEGAMNRYMTRMFMHQYFGKAYGTMGEDVLKGLEGFMNTAIIPPLPSPLGAFLGAKGYVSTGGWTGGLFKSRYNPYVDLGGGESTTELTFRALAPALADITLQAMQAGMNAPEGEAISSAAKQVGRRIVGRTAIVGDAFGVKPDVSGTTTLSDELWTNKKTIDDLAYRFRVWDTKHGEVATNKGSQAGRANIRDYMDELPPGKHEIISNPGLQQKPPQNPLYNMLMKEIENTFIKDDPKKGGLGFKSMWGHYGVYGQLANRMRTVNEGNAGVWVQEQLANPERMQWLREQNVNPLDFRAVKDFYTTRRNHATQLILQTIKATEQRISKMPNVQAQLKGKPFKINMLDPDEPGLQAERAEEKELQDTQ